MVDLLGRVGRLQAIQMGLPAVPERPLVWLPCVVCVGSSN